MIAFTTYCPEDCPPFDLVSNIFQNAADNPKYFMDIHKQKPELKTGPDVQSSTRIPEDFH